MAFHSVYEEYLIQHLPCLTRRGQSSDCVYVHVLGRGVRPVMGTLCVIGVLWRRNGSNGVRLFVCFLIHQPQVGGNSWKWFFPVKVAGNSGLPVTGPREEITSLSTLSAFVQMRRIVGSTSKTGRTMSDPPSARRAMPVKRRG